MNQSSYPATVLVGTEAVFEFEAAAELIFDDKAASDKFFELINDKDVLAMRVKGEETFLDRSKTKAVVVGRCDYDDWYDRGDWLSDDRVRLRLRCGPRRDGLAYDIN